MFNDLRRRLFPFLKPIFFRFWVISRGMTLGVRIAAFDREGRICLIRHSYAPGWHLPGGGVEIGETAGQAAVKELFEEAGVKSPEPLELFGIYHNRRGSSRDHVALFIVRDCIQQVPFKPNFEIEAQGFFELDDLPAGVSQATRLRLAELAAGQQSHELW